jgi:hypothetical protein
MKARFVFALAFALAVPAPTLAQSPVPVTVDNFARAGSEPQAVN